LLAFILRILSYKNQFFKLTFSILKMAKIFASFRTNADTYLKHKVSIDATWQPTDYEASLIKKTWSEDFDDLYSLGSVIYTYIFENNPNVKDLFPNIHKHGENWKESKGFGAQALKFAQVCMNYFIWKFEFV
jgi:hypothetical protein